jgi:hypothetical protein
LVAGGVDVVFHDPPDPGVVLRVIAAIFAIGIAAAKLSTSASNSSENPDPGAPRAR